MEYGLDFIPYCYYIKLFLNSWKVNYSPWSYVILILEGYLDHQVVSTKFMIIISFLSLYYVTSNHPVMGSIIVTSFNIKVYFTLLHIFRGQ